MLQYYRRHVQLRETQNSYFTRSRVLWSSDDVPVDAGQHRTQTCICHLPSLNSRLLWRYTPAWTGLSETISAPCYVGQRAVDGFGSYMQPTISKRWQGSEWHLTGRDCESDFLSRIMFLDCSFIMPWSHVK